MPPKHLSEEELARMAEIASRRRKEERAARMEKRERERPPPKGSAPAPHPSVEPLIQSDPEAPEEAHGSEGADMETNEKEQEQTTPSRPRRASRGPAQQPQSTPGSGRKRQASGMGSPAKIRRVSMCERSGPFIEVFEDIHVPD
eukprot:TRINITY_DN96312_c0_g1_i1.p2 TRINITY_DN96312_c0_g1~~TRINITY_DN96312_c0_g1_i1.p2  ORF type:complete len:144 (+),score=18.78 TRINITY_DN96312_c0_g1_i1:120-551(+)